MAVVIMTVLKMKNEITIKMMMKMMMKMINETKVWQGRVCMRRKGQKE